MAEPKKIELILPFPPSVNRLWRATKGGKVHRSKKYVDWRKHAEWAVSSRTKGQKIQGKYTLEIVAVKPDKRRRDLGNLEKAVSDLLQHLEIVEDDYLCEEIRLRWAKFGPDCHITVTEFIEV